MLEVLRFYQGSFEKTGMFERTNSGTVQFCYDSAYLDSALPHALSASLPLQSDPYEPYEYQGFFEGLVPEGRTRIELAHRLGIPPSDWLGLLEHLNCECIGALLFKRPEANINDYAPSFTAFPFDRFSTITSAPALIAAEAAETSRLSLSGAQAKLGLVHTGANLQENWFAPRGIASSTHIVKIPDENHPDLPTNEYLCMKTAEACGLNVADCFIVPSKRNLFACRRFDRPESASREEHGIPQSRTSLRLHQEDFCQAAGLPPYGKYEIEETDNFVASACRIIERFSSDVIHDKTAFAKQTMFDYFIGNCDNHLKNYSLLYSPDWNSRALAPAYDLVCTTILGYSRLMGISVGDTRDIDRITRDDWKLFAQDLRMPEALVLETLDGVKDGIAGALMSAADEAPIPGSSDIAMRILDDMRPRLEKI